MSVWRPAFEQGLAMFAEVSSAVEAAGYPSPILVGGAAVELYSASTIATGDFDIITPWQDVFETALQARGFIRPEGPGVATRGWIHPDLELGFEVVGSTMLDGLADRARVRVLEVSDGNRMSVIAIEDLIADRMGQYASGTAEDMLGQARTLFALCEQPDLDYMERRIREETDGDHGVSDVED